MLNYTASVKSRLIARAVNQLSDPENIALWLTLLFFFIRVFFLIRIGPIDAIDSGGYRNKENGFNPNNGLAKISFFGDSFRPWPVNLIYALLLNDLARAAFQICLSTLAFYLWAKFLLLRTSLYFSILFIFSISLTWVCIDLFILPESISISLLLISLYLILTGTSRSLSAVATLLLFILSLQRPTLFIFLIFTSIFFFRKKQKKVAAVLVLMSIIGYSYSLEVRNNGQARFFSTPHKVEAIGFPVGLLVWSDHKTHDLWRNYLYTFDPPACLGITKSDSGPYEYSTRISGECLEGSIWLRENGNNFFLLAPIRNTSAVLQDLKSGLVRLFLPTPDFYNARDLLRFSGVPPFPIFDPVLPAWSGINYIIAWNLFLLVLSVQLLMLFSRMRRTLLLNLWHTRELSFGLLLSSIATNYVMPSDIFRHSAPQMFGLLFILLHGLPSRSSIRDK
jgi:hypothetical protein